MNTNKLTYRQNGEKEDKYVFIRRALYQHEHGREKNHIY